MSQPPSGRAAPEFRIAQRYFYSGTDVLINKAGIQEPELAAQFERQAVARRELIRPPMANVTYAAYREIHRHNFQDVYAWAGQERDYTTGRGDASFARPEFIRPEMEKRFALIQADNNLQGLSLTQFAARAAEHINEINAIHPFIDGNGRTQRAFLRDLTIQAGYKLDLTRVSRQAWYDASRSGFINFDHTSMQQLLADSLIADK